jgi:hypothetical protein
MAAVSWVELIKLVTRLIAFQYTVAPCTKLLPFTVKVNALLPTTAAAGLREVIAGSGYSTVRDIPPDAPPPGLGLRTVMVAVPNPEMSVAGIEAVSCALLT